MNWVESIAILLVAVLATILLVPVAKRIAIKFDAIDYPAARRINMIPIPRMGGVAIFGGLVISLAVLLIGDYCFGWENPFISQSDLTVNYIGTAVGVIFMFGVGVLDDIIDLKAKPKLIGQIIAACIVAGSGVLLSSIHNPFGEGYIEFGWVAYPLTVFYLVAFANIINLIDGLDGLAAGITAISAMTIFVFSVLTNRVDAAFMSIALFGVCVGFLRYNFHPASVFMGDSGSLLLGFLLGIVSLFAVARSALFVSLLVPILAAGVPIMDTALAILRRKRAHRPIDEADRGHIHHRLLEAGFSQRATVLIMWSWTAALAVCAVFITELDGLPRIILCLVVVLVTAFGIVKLRLLQPVLLHHYNPRGKRKQNSTNAEVDDFSGADISGAPNATEPASKPNNSSIGKTD